MVTKDVAQAMRVLKEFCNKYKLCYRCPLHCKNNVDTLCSLKAKEPCDWDIPKEEL